MEEPSAGTDQLAADLPGGEQLADRGEDAPTGGDETTEEQLQADNPAEEDMLKALDPDSPSA
ncbi:hypothetical protein G5T42_07215 [Microbacterium sp. 4R-513]|nr:hypothetical protein G5T42_07215 [Microbacterium sp. 4R-513]